MTENIHFENEEKMKQKDILLLIAKYLDLIDHKLYWIQDQLKTIDHRVKTEE